MHPHHVIGSEHRHDRIVVSWLGRVRPRSKVADDASVSQQASQFHLATCTSDPTACNRKVDAPLEYKYS